MVRKHTSTVSFHTPVVDISQSARPQIEVTHAVERLFLRAEPVAERSLGRYAPGMDEEVELEGYISPFGLTRSPILLHTSSHPRCIAPIAATRFHHVPHVANRPVSGSAGHHHHDHLYRMAHLLL
jgi:hypothetical protein